MTRRRFVMVLADEDATEAWVRAMARGEEATPAEPKVARPPQGARDQGAPEPSPDAWLRMMGEAARTGMPPDSGRWEPA